MSNIKQQIKMLQDEINTSIDQLVFISNTLYDTLQQSVDLLNIYSKILLDKLTDEEVKYYETKYNMEIATIDINDLEV